MTEACIYHTDVVWSVQAIGGDGMFSLCLGCIQMVEIAALFSFTSPAVDAVLPSSQRFVYGTLFAKLIFPPFKWKPVSEKERERERGKEERREGARVWKWGRRLSSCKEAERDVLRSTFANLMFLFETVLAFMLRCAGLRPVFVMEPYDDTKCWAGAGAPVAWFAEECRLGGKTGGERAVGQHIITSDLLRRLLDGGTCVLRLLLL